MLKIIRHTYTYILSPWISLALRTSQWIKESSLCYTVHSQELSILYIVSIVCICQSQYSNSSHPNSFPLGTIHLVSISLFSFLLWNRVTCAILLHPTYIHGYSIFVFLFLTPFSVWPSLGPSSSLTVTQFCSFSWLSNIPLGYPGGSMVKNLPAVGEAVDSISGSRRYPEEVSGNTPQYFYPGNPKDRGF